MSRTVSFSFSSEDEKLSFAEYAHAKGMKLSTLAKMATYQYRAKYPLKHTKNERMVKESGGMDYASKTVQPERVEGNETEGTAIGTHE